ncbi:MAG: phospholipase D-like domain-containing protein [Deltaproteobacteria bacterium]
MLKKPRGLPLLALCLLFLAAFWPTTGVQGFDGNLNINTAAAAQLEQLPFIGEARAAAIVRARQKNGPFHETRQIRQAAGISENFYQAIVPYLSLTGDTTSATTDRAIKGDATRDKSSPSRIPIRNLGRFPVHDNELLLLLDKDYFPTLLGALKNARSEITVAMFLFKTSNSAKNRPAKVLAALAAARKRGVRVEVLLEKSSYDDGLNRENKKAARLLKRKGIRVRFDRGRVTTHTKLVIIDRRYSFIGSHNLTQAALGYNHEASLFIDNRELAEKLLRYIKGL